MAEAGTRRHRPTAVNRVWPNITFGNELYERPAGLLRPDAPDESLPDSLAAEYDYYCDDTEYPQ